MKRLLVVAFVLGVVGVSALYVFREPLMDAVAERLTADMFVAADADAFDPGPAVGSAFPPFRALHAGVAVTGLDGFMGPRGLVFFANRSVEW
jgi:hypothetical protein